MFTASAGGVGALVLLALSVENSAQFSRWHPWVLGANLCGVLAFAVLLWVKLHQLYRNYRDHVPGSRLTLRTVLVFGSLVIAPLVIVYLFSLDFINRGIDSWFRVEIKRGLTDAVTLSRDALDLRLREQARHTESLARSLHDLSGAPLQQRLDAERRGTDATDIIVFDGSGRPLGVSSAAPLSEPPALPPEMTLQLGAGRSYASLNPLADGQYTILTASPITDPGVGLGARRFLLVDFALPRELSALAEEVQRTASDYSDLSAVREPLKISFRLTLTLVVLLSALAALNGAMSSAQNLARPVQDLIAGTRAVGKGDFGQRLPLPSRDEMGFLVHSFNDMTMRLRRAREEATRSRQAVEQERERLAVILSRLSTGVIVAARDLTLRVANPSAANLLGAPIEAAPGQRLGELAVGHPRLGAFTAELAARLAAGREEWRDQIELPSDAGGRALLWACTPLPGERDSGEVVVVFEDITALLAAQREAAWREVARRLAHEIKNPLTPIQLAAERLRRKLIGGVSPENAELLESSTRTIVQQVDAMKQMVNAFSEYARAPDMRLTAFDLNQLVSEVAELYRLQDPAAEIRLTLWPDLPEIEADRGRVRQVLANLLTNGFEALQGQTGARLEIQTQLVRAESGDLAVICVRDNGPGFKQEVLGRLFEPYVTGKPRGTGLGLAIVKRIVEEHGGHIEVENRPEGGACVSVSLPVRPLARGANAGSERRAEPRRERA